MGFALSDLFVDVTTLPDDGYGLVQLFFLTLVYGCVLYFASNMISDGSELLLLIPSLAGIVGSVVLPVLGAVPDSAIVLFSGLGSDAQYQLDVGIGALAGSTISLLTIPWFLVVFAGRVNMDPTTGAALYKSPKLSPENAQFFTGMYGSGIAVGPAVNQTVWLVLGSALVYLLIEIPAIIFRDSTDLEAKESPYALAALLASVAGFIAYLIHMMTSDPQEDATKKQDEILIKGILNKSIPLAGLITNIMEMKNEELSETSSLVVKDKTVARLANVLRPFFAKHNASGDKGIDATEFALTCRDMHLKVSAEKMKKMHVEADTDGDGFLTFDEFVDFGIRFAAEHQDDVEDTKDKKEVEAGAAKAEEGEEAEEDEDKEEVPEDFATLTHDEQQFAIKMRSLWMMGVGTVVVLLFSDPMVDCFSEIGARLNIGAFYISFVLAPIAANASEIISSYNYAAKKTRASVAISLATLLGAAVMNNTFVLSVFMVLIYGRGLYFDYFAEVVVILAVELLVCLYALKTNQTLFDALVILSFYPLSIAAVYGLYYVGWG